MELSACCEEWKRPYSIGLLFTFRPLRSGFLLAHPLEKEGVNIRGGGIFQPTAA